MVDGTGPDRPADVPSLGTRASGTATTDRLRELAFGVVGTVALAGVLGSAFGSAGVGGAAAVGLVWLLFGGPYGYVLGQVLVASLLPLPLDAPAFLPAQGALLFVCFGRLLASVHPLTTVATAVGSLVVVSALLVVTLGSAASIWQASTLLLVATAVTTALFRWYDPVTGTVTVSQ